MNSMRRYSLAGGIFYLLTFVSIPTLSLYKSVRGPNFVTSSGPDTPVIVGVLLEMLTGFDRRRPLPKWKRAWTRSPSPSGARGAEGGAGEGRAEGRSIVLFADTFNRWFEPDNLPPPSELAFTHYPAVLSTALSLRHEHA